MTRSRLNRISALLYCHYRCTRVISGLVVVMAEHGFAVGDAVEVNVAGLHPLTVSEVLVDPESHGDWHPGEICEILADGRYVVQITPLVGAIETPPVEAARLRHR